MRKRKLEEIAHYDKLARMWRQSRYHRKWDTDTEHLTHGIFSSYQFVDAWLKTHLKEGQTLLDYGCGGGIHSILPAKLGARVTGIDLSKESLKIARERAKRENVERNTLFLQMDCERLSFPNNSFDYVFDGGTFSSLDLKKALPELTRVLKPAGTLIAIETLGHNPLTNVKRTINKLRGLRTGWAVSHIFKMKDLKLAARYFGSIEAHYFHLLSLLAFPFLSLPGGVALLHALEKLDSLLLRIPFLQKYAFKIVVVARNPFLIKY